MMIVTIERETQKTNASGVAYTERQDLFTYAADALDVQAIVRATLDADNGVQRERKRAERLEKLAEAISGRQFCEKGCARAIEHVARAILLGEPHPVCSGHAPEVVVPVRSTKA